MPDKAHTFPPVVSHRRGCPLKGDLDGLFLPLESFTAKAFMRNDVLPLLLKVRVGITRLMISAQHNFRHHVLSGFSEANYEWLPA